MELDIRPVIVTALFDIGRDKWDNYAQSYGGYMHWMERTLSIQSPMVIFTETKFLQQIQEVRSKYFDTTEYVVTTKEELAIARLLYSDIEGLMTSEEFKSKIQFQVPEMLQPWYNILMYNKLWWLYEACEVIQGTHYIWTDAGCYREDISEVNKSFPTHRIGNRPIFFSHHPTVSIADTNSHVMSQMRFLQGGSVIVPIDDIQYLIDKMYLVITKQIREGYIGSDEKMFDLLYLQDPDKIELKVCSWREYFKEMEKVG